MQFIVSAYQLKITLYALYFGAISGACYDVVKFIRMLFGVIATDEKRVPLISRLPTIGKRKSVFSKSVAEIIFVNILDILFATVLSVAYCIFLFAVNNGRFRWYLFAAAAIGFLLYRLSIAKLVMLMSGYIVFAVRQVFGFALLLLWQPVRLLFCGVKAVLHPVIRLKRRIIGIIRTEKIRKKLPSAVCPRSD